MELGLVKPEMLQVVRMLNVTPSPISPRLRSAELAGSARVHLDPDLVALLRDVADAVKLVRACRDPLIFYPSINFKTDQFGEPDRTFC